MPKYILKVRAQGSEWETDCDISDEDYQAYINNSQTEEQKQGLFGQVVDLISLDYHVEIQEEEL